MIPKFNTYLKESVWGEMRKKSLGQEVRREDFVNTFTKDQFYEYLVDNYELISGPHSKWEIEDGIGNGAMYVRVPLCRKTPDHSSFDILLDFSNRYITFRQGFFKNMLPENVQQYFKNDCKFDTDGKEDGMCFVRNKNGETDNKFFLNVINDVISIAKTPRLRMI